MFMLNSPGSLLTYLRSLTNLAVGSGNWGMQRVFKVLLYRLFIGSAFVLPNTALADCPALGATAESLGSMRGAFRVSEDNEWGRSYCAVYRKIKKDCEGSYDPNTKACDVYFGKTSFYYICGPICPSDVLLGSGPLRPIPLITQKHRTVAKMSAIPLELHQCFLKLSVVNPSLNTTRKKMASRL